MISQFSFIPSCHRRPSLRKYILNTHHRQRKLTSESFRSDHLRQSFRSSLMMPFVKRAKETNEEKGKIDDFRFLAFQKKREIIGKKEINYHRDSPLQFH